jgi:hypothetical protein
MRRVTLLLAAVATAMGVACGDTNDSVAGPDLVPVDGVYALQTVNGYPLPYLLFQQDSTTATVLDGHLAITSTGSWTETVNLRVVTGTDTTTQAATGSGTLFRSGSSLLFADLDNNPYYTGTASTNRLDLDAGGVKIVYSK